MSDIEIPHDAAKYMVQVAEALNGISGKVPYGEYYVSEATIEFDGEPTGFRVAADDHGTYSIHIAGEAGNE